MDFPQHQYKMVGHMARWAGVVWVSLALAAGGTQAMEFEIPRDATFSFHGPVGERIAANIEQWLLPAPEANPGMVEMFRVRDRKPQPQLVPWAGEFIGKYLISAIQARRMTEDPRLDARVDEVIQELLATQAGDGYLGPFREEERLLGHWDLWGHYHIMLALMMWHEDTGDADALAATIRAADLICRVYLDGDRRPIDAGSDEMNLSIIHALGRLYRHTGEERYFQLMERIVADWETPPAGDYYRQGLADIPFYRMPKPRWESLHSIQGMVELYRITGDSSYRKAFMSIWHSIAAYDVHNTGAFSTNEQAVGNPYAIGAIETCCQVAWTAMTVDMLLLTGDARVADELERGFWNAILAYQHPSGRWNTYHTPSDGVREASAHSIVFQARHGTPELNCCSVNAPRGLGMLSEWAMMVDPEVGGLTVNYYGPMEAVLPLPAGGTVTIRQETAYPVDGRIRLHLSVDEPAEFPLRLRIPGWTTAAQVSVNRGVAESVDPGGYYEINRTWHSDDTIMLELDMTLHTWIGDVEREGKLSVYRGPLLLAYDQRYNTFDPEDLPILDYTDLTYRSIALPQAMFPPMLAVEMATTGEQPLILCDFAHAGAHGTHYVSWLPVTNAPPAPFRLESPDEAAVIPAGPTRFRWHGTAGSDTKVYTVRIARDASFEDTVAEVTDLRTFRYALRDGLDRGGTYYWTVEATNSNGTVSAVDGPRSFTVDPDLPNPLREHPSLIEFREDALAAGSPLDGSGEPVYGVLEEMRNIEPAVDRQGRPNGAVRFRGDGLLRYRIAEFPREDYTFLAWVRPEAPPAGMYGQIISAWQKAMDDPLRVYIREDTLAVRIEAGLPVDIPPVPVEWEQWIHVAVVKQGATLTLYIDGQRRGTAAAPERLGTTVAEDFALGGNPHFEGDEYFHGCLDDFAFYGRAFTPDEIARAYREGIGIE